MLIIPLSDKNEFKIDGDIELFDEVRHLTFKIDTGCSITTIPFKKIGDFSNEVVLNYKKTAIKEGRPYKRSYGVSDSREKMEKDKELIRLGKLEECTSLKFLYNDCVINFGNYRITSDIHINFDRTGNILIGMDILSKFDFHCGRSLKTDEYLFIGCLKSNITQKYVNALYEHFGIDYLGKIVKDTNDTAAALRNHYSNKDFT